MAAGPGGQPAAERGELEALREVAQRQAVRAQLVLQRGPEHAGLDPRGPAGRVDLQHPVQRGRGRARRAGSRRRGSTPPTTELPPPYGITAMPAPRAPVEHVDDVRPRCAGGRPGRGRARGRRAGCGRRRGTPCRSVCRPGRPASVRAQPASAAGGPTRGPAAGRGRPRPAARARPARRRAAGRRHPRDQRRPLRPAHGVLDRAPPPPRPGPAHVSGGRAGPPARSASGPARAG